MPTSLICNEKWFLQVPTRIFNFYIFFNGMSTHLGVSLYLKVRESHSLYVHILIFYAIVSWQFFLSILPFWVRGVMLEPQN